jgi:hypothetical protein
VNHFTYRLATGFLFFMAGLQMQKGDEPFGVILLVLAVGAVLLDYYLGLMEEKHGTKS